MIKQQLECSAVKHKFVQRTSRLQTDGIVLSLVRSYLSFRDICATKRVCKTWADTSKHRVKELIFFVEDGAPFNLPNCNHVQFRKSLQSMIIHRLHCEIYSQEQLDFVKTIIGNVHDLYLELDGDRSNDEYFESDEDDSDSYQTEQLPPVWGDNFLRTLVPHARHIDALFFNVPQQRIRLDFSCLPRLESFKSNVQIHVENYDKRPMKYFACQIDYWSATVTEIASNSEIVALQKDFQQGPDFPNFWMNWSPASSPRLIFCSSGADPFMELGSNNDGVLVLELCSPFGLGDFELETLEYQAVLRHILRRFPHISLQFDKCDRNAAHKWQAILLPVFMEYGLTYPDPFNQCL